ncbi:MAG: phosphoribosylamine--glycine ligase [Thermomicrobiales bacterium]
MGIRVLVIGGGGREHAIVWKLAQSDRVAELFCAPGNPGIAALATCLPVPAMHIDGIVAIAKLHKIDLAVIGPEDPLAAGLADRLRAEGIAVAGHNAAAARIESSKSWAKEIMAAANVATARSITVTDRESGYRAIDEIIDADGNVVVKADGLAVGKGVVVAGNRKEAERALDAMMSQRAFGDAGKTVVVEEFMTGMELSVLALTDGRTIHPLVPSCDYKRVGDGDVGPNTGGMGAYTRPASVDAALMARIQREILEPTIAAMAAHDAPMQGVLFAGLILTADGPKVIEFNARFGDPETQVVLPTMDGDLGLYLEAVADGWLDKLPVPAMDGYAVTVAMASAGYPGAYEKGVPIAGLDEAEALDDVLVFHAGTAQAADGAVVTAGGRVLSVVGLGGSVREAHDRAYDALSRISFTGAQHRTDIAARELS